MAGRASRTDLFVQDEMLHGTDLAMTLRDKKAEIVQAGRLMLVH
jgi:hypothetical protein